MSQQDGSEIGVIYGEYRIKIAQHFSIDPADVTGVHVEIYEQQMEAGQ